MHMTSIEFRQSDERRSVLQDLLSHPIAKEAIAAIQREHGQPRKAPTFQPGIHQSDNNSCALHECIGINRFVDLLEELTQPVFGEGMFTQADEYSHGLDPQLTKTREQWEAEQTVEKAERELRRQAQEQTVKSPI